MSMPKMDEQSRKRPISYDPSRDKFILYDDVISGKEKIVPVESLSEEDLKKLVIRRYQVLEEDNVVQPMSGPRYKPADVIRAIQQNEPFGKMTVQAETAYLKHLLEQIRQAQK